MEVIKHNTSINSLSFSFYITIDYLNKILYKTEESDDVSIHIFATSDINFH